VPNETLLKAGPLWAKTSARGNRYLVGRLGGVKVMILENRDRQDENDPTHTLFFAPAPERPRQTGADTPRSTGAAPGRSSSSGGGDRPPNDRQRRRSPAGPDPDLNDELPF
jgi:hypothetical protein